MNQTIDLLMKRKSVRAYTEQPVTPAEKEIILSAAIRAPTAGNMMLYSIIEIEDQAIKDRLAVICDHQPFIAEAPFVLLFAADYQRWYDYYLAMGIDRMCQERNQVMRKPQEGDLLLACTDTVIAAQTAVIAAESLGIGSCYIGDTIENYEEQRDLFGLPQYVLPVSLVCFGYPAPAQVTRKQTTRFAEEFVVFKNQYCRLGKAQLEQMMQPRNDQMNNAGPRQDGFVNVAQVNYFKKFNADFSLEMTRSVKKMIESWTNPTA